MKNFLQMFKQFQKLQSKLSKIQDELASREYSAESGAGMVRVTMDGKMRLTGIHVEPDVAKENDLEMITDLIMAAVNEVLKRVQEETAAEMKKISGNLPIPDELT